MFEEQIENQTFCEHVRNLGLGINWVNNNCVLFDMFSEVMIFQGDMSGSWADFGGVG